MSLPLQTLELSDDAITVVYKGVPLYQVTGWEQKRHVWNLMRLRGESEAADYVISVGDPVP